MNFLAHAPRLSLDGADWSFAVAPSAPDRACATMDDLRAAGLTLHSCAVPGNVELDLVAAGIETGDPFEGMNMARYRKYERCHVWYTRAFDAQPPAGHEAHLVFEGIDCIADIFLNGQSIGATDNMLVEHAFRVDGLLRPTGNELVVHLKPVLEKARDYDYPANLFTLGTNHDSLYVRKAPHMYGWDIMPRAISAGLWRPVTLRYRPAEHIERVYLETTRLSGDRREAAMVLHFRLVTGGDTATAYEIAVEGRCGSSTFSASKRVLFDAGHLPVDVTSPELWWPRGRGEPRLYDVTVRLLKDGREIDRMMFRHGIRTVHLERTDVTDEEGNGEFCFHVNGERVFARGTNWVPVDAYHSRDAARIPAVLDMAADLDCNMIRCWGGNVYENDLFYDLCDQKGIMVWQDFTMACAVYPQDDDFRRRLRDEAVAAVRRLRQHPCIVLWAGDNECDLVYSWAGRRRDPNVNTLTREVLPGVLRDEDVARPYLPSSPYIAPEAFRKGEQYLPENHLWGPRDYFKSEFYRTALCHFVSEIGYHGCPSPDSIRRFISPDKVWPYQDNEEWILHATSPIPGVNLWDYRVELMAKQVVALFGEVPATLEDFAFASQASQAEAVKFFIESFRSRKWHRTGILWWNLMDGWPQFSDAVVDYYFGKKLAYEFIKRSQARLCLMLTEPEEGQQRVVGVNDTREDIEVSYTIRDIGHDRILMESQARVPADTATAIDTIDASPDGQRFLLLRWESSQGGGRNHYLGGRPPFALETYREWLGAL